MGSSSPQVELGSDGLGEDSYPLPCRGCQALKLSSPQLTSRQGGFPRLVGPRGGTLAGLSCWLAKGKPTTEERIRSSLPHVSNQTGYRFILQENTLRDTRPKHKQTIKSKTPTHINKLVYKYAPYSISVGNWKTKTIDIVTIFLVIMQGYASLPFFW